MPFPDGLDWCTVPGVLRVIIIICDKHIGHSPARIKNWYLVLQFPVVADFEMWTLSSRQKQLDRTVRQQLW